MTSWKVFPDHLSFVTGAAELIVGAGARAVAERGRFVLALSGGSTPKPIYARLAGGDYRDRLDWENVHIFFGDERCVPPDDPRSNYRMVREAWLDHAPIPAQNIHRIRGEDDPAVEAQRYEREIARVVGSDGPPAFDLILLGMGGDGHTASLFPRTPVLRETVRWVAAQWVEGMSAWRVTFTVPLLNAARCVAFLVEGGGKAETLRSVIEGPHQPDVWPAQLIQPVSGDLLWLLDAAAAARLGRTEL